MTLGMAVGGYKDDCRASRVPFAQRGRRFDEMLDEMTPDLGRRVARVR